MDAIESFIARWRDASGGELANYQLFLSELIALLDLPRPDPAREDTRDNAYVFERGITFAHGDGSRSAGRIDLYRRGAFVCEAKKVRGDTASKGYDDALQRARGQAESYARALPAAEGRPAFLIVVDVGRAIELYADFTRSGATYTPFPDPRSHRLALDALRDDGMRERLRAVFLDPMALDPTRRAAKVTREIAVRLAEIAKSLEAAGHDPERAAGFLTRCLFTFFAEDVELIPKDSFRNLLEELKGNPAQFVPIVAELWRAMDAGSFSIALKADLLEFNGKLFKQPDVLPLTRAQIELLIEAAKAKWNEVEPAIFGTLLERALDPEVRHALGAHYTPRAYVERLVLPTVIEPLREDWSHAHAAALTLAAEGDVAAALAEIKKFHSALCKVRVLDPACGSGNFLYVTLEHLKRLEGEVLNAFDELDPARQHQKLRQGGLAFDAARANPFGDETVDPHQLLGIEINPRAAAIAEMVLWIGYLQWHFRTVAGKPNEPVLRDFHNIECRDAVLAYDRVEFVADERGVPITRWDGKTTKAHPVTGEQVPDETARVPVERYVNPRQAQWPAADFVVGNPPFVGTWRMRLVLGDGYVEALFNTWRDVPENADFVMYWWNHGAALLSEGRIRKLGLITTNSIVQIFNRAVLARWLAAKPPISIELAIPDHPWVDSESGAAVRIAMTVARCGSHPGKLVVLRDGATAPDGEVFVLEVDRRSGFVQADLRVGASPAAAQPLKAAARVAFWGVKFYGDGFVVDDAHLREMDRVDGSSRIARSFVSGRDLTGRRRHQRVLDCDGLQEAEVRERFPAAYQHLLMRVKPVREHNPRSFKRERWWIFGENQPGMRNATRGLRRFVVTTETAVHRFFEFLDGAVLAEGTVAVVALDDAKTLGVLSSRVHSLWALASGGTLEDRPRYNKTRCFETFAFPTPGDHSAALIGKYAEQLDTDRKRQQAAHPDLTLTGMYNVLEKLRRNEALTANERVIHEQGLVSVLREIHDELDRAVFEAYGWSDLADKLVGLPGATTPYPNKSAAQAEAEEELLARLVALNAERTAEEKRGLIRWLRPELQNPHGERRALQAEIETEAEDVAVPAAKPTAKQLWPKSAPEQARAVASALARRTRRCRSTKLPPASPPAAAGATACPHFSTRWSHSAAPNACPTRATSLPHDGEVAWQALIHSRKSSTTRDAEDEWSRVSCEPTQHAGKRVDEELGHLRPGQVLPRENERAHVGLPQHRALKSVAANGRIFR